MTCSPFECLYGHIPVFEDANLVNVADRMDEIQSTQELRQKVQRNVDKMQQKYKAYYDKTHYEGVEYKIGDIVVMKRNPIPAGESTKTQMKYRGPLEVLEKLPGDCYRLEKLNNEDEGKVFTTVSHVSRMKIYKNHEDDNTEGVEDEEEESNGRKVS